MPSEVFFRQRPWLWPTVILLGGTLYLTLYPFDFSLPWAVAWHRLDWGLPGITSGHHSRLDILSNILLFMPLGFAFGNLWQPLKARYRLPLILLMAAVTSTTIEILQSLIPERDPALIDIICNTCGALGGALGARLLRLKISPGLKESAFYLAIASFLLYGPFDFSLDWGELKAHLKTVHLAPSFPNLLLPALFLSLSVFALPLKRLQGTLLCLLLGILLEGGRVFVLSASLSVGKVLIRLVLGLLFYLILSSIHREPARRALVLFFLALGFLLEAWYPFSLASPALKTEAFLPFFYFLTYFTPTSLLHLLEIILLFMAFGTLGKEILTRPLLFLGAIFVALLAEGGQPFIQGRVPDVTTGLLAALGVWMALKIFEKEGQDDL